MSRSASHIDAGSRLFSDNVGLVHMVVREMRGRATPGFDVEDMTQEGMLGLLHAARNWDPARGFRFSSYAVPCIRGAIRSAWTAKAAQVRQRPAGRSHMVVAVPMVSLDVPRNGDEAFTLADRLPDRGALDPAMSAASADLTRRLRRELRSLEPTQRAVMVLRYGLDGAPGLTPEKVAAQLHLTTARTRKIEAEALMRLRQQPCFWA